MPTAMSIPFEKIARRMLIPRFNQALASSAVNQEWIKERRPIAGRLETNTILSRCVRLQDEARSVCVSTLT